MPAVTLIAMVLGGLTIALSEREPYGAGADRHTSAPEERYLPVG
jgi:hypothetical protein